MATHNKLGSDGERVAERYLNERGYVTVERNWHSSHKELDLVMHDRHWLVVVEVKTRTGHQWEDPTTAVDEHKQRRIVQAAHHYVRAHRVDRPVRFDIVTVVLENGRWQVEHFEDAFLPPRR